jgi:hypothetical protein
MSDIELLEYCGADAYRWAEKFCETAKTLGHDNIDHGWMIGWFANAIERADQIRGKTRNDEIERLTRELALAKALDDRRVMAINAMIKEKDELTRELAEARTVTWSEGPALTFQGAVDEIERLKRELAVAKENADRGYLEGYGKGKAAAIRALEKP